MRIHTCAIEEVDLHAAAYEARVDFDTLTERGSRSQTRAWDVKLFGSSGRQPNFGGGDGIHEAASWDEWGIFIAALYRLDPLMRTPYYHNAEHFHWVTGLRFVTLTWPEQHRQHKWSMGQPDYSGLFSEATCEGTKGPSNPGCGAVQRWLLRHRGVGDWEEVCDSIPEVGYYRAGIR